MFQTNSYVNKISTTPDKGLKITLTTQELDNESMATLFELMNKFTWVAFKDFEKGDILEEELEIPEVQPTEKGDKSPSTRLRNALYVWYMQNRSGKEDFDTFYKRQMEKIIDKVKSNLD